MNKKVIKFVWNHKRSGIAEVILRKMTKPGGVTLANFKLHWRAPLEEETAAHSRILAWKIPWTKEPGGLQSMGSQRVGHN